MKRIILILLLAISNFIFGQNFAPTGAIWHYQNYCQTPSWINNCGYFTAESVGDSILINDTLQIIEYRNLGTLNVDALVLIKEENSKVYFYENNEFKLLYNFNLLVGDTLTYQIPINANYYDFSCGQSADTSKFARAIIDSVNTINNNGQLLKTLYTSNIYNGDTNLYFDWELVQVIERIGSLNGFFGYSPLQCLGGFPGHFRCYNDNLINYTTVTENCDFVTGINSLNDKENIFTYPNPALTHFIIKGIDKAYDLTLYNAVGQVLLQKNNINTASEKININNYKSGLLFIKIESEGDVFYQKMIKK